MCWTEREYAYRHENEKFLTEEESYSFGRTSSHRRVGAKQKLIDDVELEQHRIKLMREGSSSNHIERRSNIIHRDDYRKPRLRCKDSDDLHLVVGEGKVKFGETEVKILYYFACIYDCSTCVEQVFFDFANAISLHTFFTGFFIPVIFLFIFLHAIFCGTLSFTVMSV